MAVNDRNMLPSFVLNIPEMADLLQAEQKEIDNLEKLIEDVKNELNIATCKILLPRYERIFDSKNIGTIDERRKRIIAKFNMRRIPTVRMIKNLIEILTECKADIVEHFSDFRFDIVLQGFDFEKKWNPSFLYEQLDEAKPAHLLYNVQVTFKPLLISEKEVISIVNFKVPFSNENINIDMVKLNGTKKLDGSWRLSIIFRSGLKTSHLKLSMKQKETESIQSWLIIEKDGTEERIEL